MTYDEIKNYFNELLGRTASRSIRGRDLLAGLTAMIDKIKGIDISKLNGKSAYQSYLETTTDNPKLTESVWASRPKDGKSPIVTEEWGKSTSTTVAPTSWLTTWLATQPVNAGEYLWIRYKYTYPDNTFQYSSPHVFTADSSIIGTRAKVSKVRKSVDNIASFVTIIPDQITNNSGGFSMLASSSVIQIDLTALNNYEPFIVDGIVFSTDYSNYFCFYDKPFSDATKTLLSFENRTNSRVSDSFAPPLNAKYLFLTKDRAGYYTANIDNLTLSRGFISYADLVEKIDEKKILADKLTNTNFKFAADRTKENVFPSATIVENYLVNQIYELTYTAGWKYAETDVSGKTFVMLAGITARPGSAVYWRVINASGQILLKGNYVAGQELGIILPENSAKFQYDIKSPTDIDDSVYENAFVAFSAKITGINEHSVGSGNNDGGDVEFNTVTANLLKVTALQLEEAPVWDEVSPAPVALGRTYTFINARGQGELRYRLV